MLSIFTIGDVELSVIATVELNAAPVSVGQAAAGNELLEVGDVELLEAPLSLPGALPAGLLAYPVVLLAVVAVVLELLQVELEAVAAGGPPSLRVPVLASRLLIASLLLNLF